MSLAQQSDAIVAIATAPGKGGVGVVRVSIPDSESFLQFQKIFFRRTLSPRAAHFVRLLDSDGHVLDEGLALAFPAPASFTGENVIEFQGHGGTGVLRAILGRVLQAGKGLPVSFRHAQPGEFTQRAFLNDKMDLAQAEAVADLIDASTHGAVKAAAASLTGVFSEKVNHLADLIVHLRLLLEATLDFPEEEIDFLEKADAKGQLRKILDTHSELMIAASEGVKFRDGLQVVLIGQPNVGKSSLLNALAGEEVAIVTSVAGTTRDRIKQELNIRGIPLTVIDTAGLRHTDDEVEKIGIERTLSSLDQADLALHLIDAREAAHPADIEIRSKLPKSLSVLTVYNKADLASNCEAFPHDAALVSAKTLLGLEVLKDRIFEISGLLHTPDHGFMARQRHLDALQVCAEHLRLAQEFAEQDDRILDLFAEELRLAHDALGEITGRLLPDDLLGLIFSRFCIGK